jgi:hypothetical protein
VTVCSRIREEFAKFFRTYGRRKHRHSIFFSDQLLGTPLAFDLLNPGQRKESHQCHTRFTRYLQIATRKELRRDRLISPKARMARRDQLMSATEVILAELSEIEKIIANEARLASERVGYPVDPHSPEIQTRIAEIILSGMGVYLRNLVTAAEPGL